MVDNKIRLLLLEDDRVDQMAIERLISNEKLPYELQIAGSVSEARNLIASHDFDVIIADYLLGDGTFFDLMDRIEDVPIIVTTGAGDEETAVKAMKAGACDYLIKDSQGNYLHTLPLVVKKALKSKQDEEELRNYRARLESMVIERTAKLEEEITERKQAEEKLRTNDEHLRSLVESAKNFAVFRLVGDNQIPGRLRVVFASSSIKDIFGIQEPMNFESWFEHIHPEDLARVTEAHLKSFETLKFDEEFRTFNKNRGKWQWIHAVSTGGRNEKCWNRYFNGIVIDVTDKYKAFQELKKREIAYKERLKTALKEKDNLILDIHHRVKNNLQIICSLLSLQKKYINDKNIIKLLGDIGRRIQSMALVHEKLYLSDNLSEVKISDFFNTLIREIRSFCTTDKQIEIICKIDKLTVQIETAIPIALLLNELITNAYRHAFVNKEEGEIFVEFNVKTETDYYRLEVSDNGNKFPQDFDLQNISTLGYRLITALTSQLKGSIRLSNENGTKVTVEIPMS